MGVVYKKEDHNCAYHGMPSTYEYGHGTLWKCNGCGKLWKMHNEYGIGVWAEVHWWNFLSLYRGWKGALKNG